MRFGLVVALFVLFGVGLGIGAAVLAASEDSSADAAVPNSVVETSAEVTPELLDTSREAQQILAEEFLTDWARFRKVEAVVRSSVTRTALDGTTLEDVQVLVQDTTGRLIRSFAGIQGYTGETAVFCSSVTGDAEESEGLTCRDLDSAPTRTTALTTELNQISGLVIGDPPRYRLIDSGANCWELVLTTQTLDAPYGDSTTFCFDETTGTMARSETVHANGIIEVVEAQTVRSLVTPDDFASLLGS